MDREKINRMKLIDKWNKTIDQRKRDLIMLRDEINKERHECEHGPYVLLDRQKRYLGAITYDDISAKCLICGRDVINLVKNTDLVIDMTKYYTEETLIEKRNEMQMGDARNLFMAEYNQNKTLTEEEIIENIRCKLNQKDKQKVKKY